MRILYVTSMTTPLENILRGKTHIEGHPALYFPMRMLIARGHRIEFILRSNIEGPFDVKVDWFSEELVLANLSMQHSTKGGVYRIGRGLFRMIQLAKAVWDATKHHEYDFIYAHGPSAAIVQVVGHFRRIAVGVRKYGAGIHTYSDIQAMGRVRAALKHPLDFANFRLPHVFLLMTDDNTSGQEVFEAWRPKKPKGDFLLWKTGVDLRSVDCCESDRELPEEDFIFFAGRFDRTKRQDRVVEIVKLLHDRGRRVHLYFAGPLEPGPSDPIFISELRRMVSAYGIDEYVHFLGAVPQETLRVFASRAVATVFMQETSNMGNVLYEAMSAGGIVIASEDGFVGEIIDDGINGFIASSPTAGASVVERLLDDLSLRSDLRERARATALSKFVSLEERYGREVDLIEGLEKGRGRGSR